MFEPYPEQICGLKKAMLIMMLLAQTLHIAYTLTLSLI